RCCRISSTAATFSGLAMLSPPRQKSASGQKQKPPDRRKPVGGHILVSDALRARRTTNGSSDGLTSAGEHKRLLRPWRAPAVYGRTLMVYSVGDERPTTYASVGAATKATASWGFNRMPGPIVADTATRRMY